MGQLEPVNMPRIIEDLEAVLECVRQLYGGIRDSIRTPDREELSVDDWDETAEMFCEWLADEARAELTESRRRLSVLLNDGDVGLLDADKRIRRSLEIAWPLVQAAPLRDPFSLEGLEILEGFNEFAGFEKLLLQQLEFLKAEREAPLGRSGSPRLTSPMTLTCIAEIFTCGRNQVRSNVLAKYYYSVEGKSPREKFRMRVEDMRDGWMDIVRSHAPGKRKSKK